MKDGGSLFPRTHLHPKHQPPNWGEYLSTKRFKPHKTTRR